MYLSAATVKRITNKLLQFRMEGLNRKDSVAKLLESPLVREVWPNIESADGLASCLKIEGIRIPNCPKETAPIVFDASDLYSDVAKRNAMKVARRQLKDSGLIEELQLAINKIKESHPDLDHDGICLAFKAAMENGEYTTKLELHLADLFLRKLDNLIVKATNETTILTAR